MAGDTTKTTQKIKTKQTETSSKDPMLEEKERQARVQEIFEVRELAFSEEEKTLLVWKAPARAFKKKNREYYTTVGAIVILLSLILLFAREFLLVAAIFSIGFVAYVLSTVEPETVEHEVTTRGIRSGGKFFRWDELGRFWYQEKYGQKMLIIETYLNFPTSLLLLLGDQSEEKLSQILSKFLLLETPEDTFVDKASVWLQKKVPLED